MSEQTVRPCDRGSGMPGPLHVPRPATSDKPSVRCTFGTTTRPVAASRLHPFKRFNAQQFESLLEGVGGALTECESQGP